MKTWLARLAILFGVCAAAGCATRPTVDLSADTPTARLIAASGIPSYSALTCNPVRMAAANQALQVKVAGDDFASTSAYCQLVLSNFEQRADAMRWVAFATA